MGIHWKPVVWVTLLHFIAYLEGFKVSSEIDSSTQNSSLLLHGEINDQCDILRELSKQKIHNEGFKSLRISTQRVTSKGGTESLNFKRYLDQNQDNFRRIDSRLIRNASPEIRQMTSTRRNEDNLRRVNERSLQQKQFIPQREISRDENRIARQFSNLNRAERTQNRRVSNNRRVSRSVERSESFSRNLENRVREDERKFRGENIRSREIERRVDGSRQIINRPLRERNERSLENNRRERAYNRNNRQVREISNTRDDQLNRSARKENERITEQRVRRVMTNDVRRDVNRESEIRQNERRRIRDEMKNMERRNAGRLSLRRQEWIREKRETRDNRQTREVSLSLENDRVLNGNVRRKDRRLPELSYNTLKRILKRVENRLSNNINERQILRTRNQRSETIRNLDQRFFSEQRDNEMRNMKVARSILRRHSEEEILMRKENMLEPSQDYRRVISEKREISSRKMVSGIRHVDLNRIITKRYGDNMREISKIHRRSDKNRNLNLSSMTRLIHNERNFRSEKRRNSPKLYEKDYVNRHLILSDTRISKIRDSVSSHQNYKSTENREALRKFVHDNSVSRRRQLRIRADMENQMVLNIPKLIITSEIKNRRINSGQEIRNRAEFRKIRNEYMTMQKFNILENSSDGIFEKVFKEIGDTWKSSLSLIGSVLGTSESLLDEGGQSIQLPEKKYKAIFTNSLMFGLFSVQIAGLIKGKNLV